MKKVLSFILIGFVLGIFCSLLSNLIINKDVDLNNVQESLVYIEAISSDSVSKGSGFVYKNKDNKNYIITSYHVIDDYEEILVYTDQKSTIATVLNYDEYTDIAVITIDDELGLEEIKLGDSSKINVGDQIYVAGTPLNSNYISTITSGIISYIDREISVTTTVGNSSINAIQVDAAINPGNSGGPLLNNNGQVIGLVFIKEADLNGIGFAIPINFVMNIVNKLEKNELNRPNLGAIMVNTTNDKVLKEYSIDKSNINGVVLLEVKEKGLFYDYNLQKGDIITKFNNVNIENVQDLQNELYSYNIEDIVVIEYYRNGISDKIKIELK